MPSAEPFVAVHIDAVPAGPERGPGIAELKPVRRHLGIEAFGANARVAREAGEVLVIPHDERVGGPFGTDGHEELYVVLRGRATFTVDGREVDAPAGTLVFVRDPAAERSAVAAAPDTAVLAVGGAPGAPYRVAAWEQRDIDAQQP
jgi:mannose-6-phosphate isomerase-like protein (cupin superfamily)